MDFNVSILKEIRKYYIHTGIRVRINVSGRVFETYERTLTSKPGSIFKLKNVWNYFDPDNLEFYFDRDPKSFSAIFTYMQCGVLVKPDQVMFFSRFEVREIRFLRNTLSVKKKSAESDKIFGL